MTSGRRSLGGNTLHETAVAKEHVCVVIDEVIAGFVENSSGVRLSNCKTNGIGKTLTEGTSGDLNTRSIGLYPKQKLLNYWTSEISMGEFLQLRDGREFWSQLDGIVSSPPWRDHIRTGATRNIGACIHGRCYMRIISHQSYPNAIT